VLQGRVRDRLSRICVGSAWLVLAGALALVAAPIEAFASAGCDAVNNNTGNVSFAIPGSTLFASESFSGQPFSPGDVVTAVARTDDGAMTHLGVGFGNGSLRSAELNYPINSFQQVSITAVGNESSLQTSLNTFGQQGDTFTQQITVSCVPGPANASSTLLQGGSGTVGNAVSVTATVLGTASNGTPTGSVLIDFGDGSTTSNPTLSSGAATVNHTYAAAGSYTVTATYTSDNNNYTTSTGTAVENIGKGVSTSTLSPTPTTVAVGQSITYNVTVNGAGVAPGGTAVVSFGDGTQSNVSISSGAGSINHTYSAAGSYSASVNYQGDSNYLVSSATSSSGVTITKGTSTTTLTPTPPASLAGQSVTFAISVSGAGVVPAGQVTVNFGDGATSNVNLNGAGAGSVQHTYTTSGSFTAVATYAGNVNYLGSSSNAGQSVTQASSSVSLISSKNPSTFGQSVTLTATVSGVNPTGTVQFKDGGTNLGSAVTLNGAGQALLTTASLAAGSHSITAVYSGDVSNTGAASSALTQSVGQAATSVSLVSSLNPSQVGQSVTFTATVASGGGTPTGLVNFLDGASVLGSASLSGGIASFSTSALTLGSHTITASFAASGNFTGSASAPVIQAVNTPTDSLKLRAMQVLATPTEAQ
jgi:hypothetical protein